MQTTQAKKIIAFLSIIIGLYLVYVTPLGSLISYVFSNKSPLKKREVLRIKRLQGPTDIYIDKHAVPYITSSNVYDLTFATGLIQYYLKGHQLEYLRSAAKGELSLLLGQVQHKGFSTLKVDRESNAWKFQKRASQAFQTLSSVEKKILSSFVQGINFSQARYKPFKLRFLQYEASPWTEKDIVAIYLHQAWTKREPSWRKELLEQLLKTKIAHLSAYQSKLVSKEGLGLIESQLSYKKLLAPRILLQQFVGSSQVSGFAPLAFPFITTGHNKIFAWLTHSASPQVQLRIEKKSSKDKNFVLSENKECPIEQKEMDIRQRKSSHITTYHIKVRETCHGLVLNDIYPELFHKDSPLITAQWNTPKLTGLFKGHYEVYQLQDAKSIEYLQTEWSKDQGAFALNKNGKLLTLQRGKKEILTGKSPTLNDELRAWKSLGNDILKENIDFITQGLKKNYSESPYYLSLLNWNRTEIKNQAGATVYFLLTQKIIEQYQKDQALKLSSLILSLGNHQLFNSLFKLNEQQFNLLVEKSFLDLSRKLKKLAKQKDLNRLATLEDITLNDLKFLQTFFTPNLYNEQLGHHLDHFPAFWFHLYFNANELNLFDQSSPMDLSILDAREFIKKSAFYSFEGQVDWPYHQSNEIWKKNWQERKSYQFEQDSLLMKRNSKWMIELMPAAKK